MRISFNSRGRYGINTLQPNKYCKKSKTLNSVNSKISSQISGKIKYKRVRRGGKSSSGQKLKIISTNSQGDKFSSLVGLVKSKGAAVITVQETRSRKKNKHSLEGFVIFEAIRKKVGGGTMLGIHDSLNPILISAYEDEFELVVVETKIGQKYIRFITGYGPQETWEESEKLPFFIAHDKEIGKAQLEISQSLYQWMQTVCWDLNIFLGTCIICQKTERYLLKLREKK